MARDDYFIIVYQLLSYLYQCLKKGEKVNPKYLKADSPFFKQTLADSYWRYILKHMVSQNYIEGIVVDDPLDNAGTLIYNLEEATITPEGIEYLNDNSVLSKVREFAKGIKESVPFI